jgi:hypothetical protein
LQRCAPGTQGVGTGGAYANFKDVENGDRLPNDWYRIMHAATL